VIDASGVLTFTPAADANGSATVTVSLSDNGGTAREGVDTSLATASLNISITAVNDAPQLTAPAALTAEEDIAAAPHRLQHSAMSTRTASACRWRSARVF
jgi:hypothetical protein